MLLGGLLQINQTGRVGVGYGCEAGGLASGLRLAAEGRCQLLDEDEGAVLSLSVATAAGYTPFFERGGMWTRAGVDVSRRSGGHGFLLDLYGSYGHEAYSVNVDVTSTDPERAEPPYAAMVRREARVSAAIGFGWLDRDLDGVPMGRMVTVALVPYRTVWHADPSGLDCVACLRSTVRAFDTSSGIALMLSVGRIPGMGR